MDSRPEQNMEDPPKVSAHTQDPFLDASMPQLDQPATRGSTTKSVCAKPSSCDLFDTKRFDNLDAMTRGLITAELKDLKRTFAVLHDSLGTAAAKEGHLRIVQSGIQHLIARIEQSPNNQLGRLAEVRCQRNHNENDMKAQEAAFAHIRTKLMNEVLASIEALWERRSTDSHELTELRQKMHEMDTELDDLRAAKKTLTHGWDIERKVAKNLAERLAGAMRNLTAQERELGEKYRELEKEYYENVQKLVEDRVNDESAKLAERLSNAEAKVLRYDKMTWENEELHAKVAELEREKVSFQQAKSELEHRHKAVQEEAKAFRKGYDQLSIDNQALQTEKAMLQADYDELIMERDRLLEDRKSEASTRATTFITARSQASSSTSTTTAFERQTAELQHLDGLVAIWQKVCDSAISHRDESQKRKEEMTVKIREAERRLKEMKPDRSSKTRRNTGESSEKLGAKASGVSDEQLQQPFVNTDIDTPRKSHRIATEAFPALGSPIVPPQKPTAWKSLRLVDMPKKPAP
jgi:chromosome segregation ATPase